MKPENVLEAPICLPITPQTKNDPTPLHDRQGAQSACVLVVASKAVVLDRLAKGLRQKGFVVRTAGDGQAALDLYRRHADAIHLVLLDVCLPGLDGPQTLAALRRLNPKIRCCFMLSRHNANYTEGELLDLGALALLNRPFSITEVAQVLWSLLGRPPKGDKCLSVLSWCQWERGAPRSC
jgi:two-component system, OmpR family, response regulator